MTAPLTPFHAPISAEVWGKKYQFKDKFTGEVYDHTVEDTWLRIATALAAPEKEPERWVNAFYDALEGFKFIPAGRILAGAGTDRRVTLFNCYVMGTIPDSMAGIFESLKEAALTMQQGGGIGYDFSTIRPKGAQVKQVAADASGPLTFMDVWDSMCRTIMSAGSRRGAMMATMRCDHPDIEAFIEAKADPNRLRMFNMSVLVTDAFMKAVHDDAGWALVHEKPASFMVKPEPDFLEHHHMDGTVTRVPSKNPPAVSPEKHIYKVVRARELWDKIMRSTYDYAEPGVIFVDKINSDNNLKYMETISATNPCGEQPLPPYGACLLGSINLAALIENPYTERAGIDATEIKVLVRTAVRMMDNVNDVSLFPLPEQQQEALSKRRIGLGVTGLADALLMVGLRYGSDAAAERTEKWMQLIALEAYKASIELAREKGPFPALDVDKYLGSGQFSAMKLPTNMKQEIREVGIRNSHLLSIAPTGTISLYAGNVSSGIEPIFAPSYNRKMLEDNGTKSEQRVVDYAVAVWEKKARDEGYALNAEDPLPPAYVDAQSLTPAEHVKMQAAAQKWVDTSISKTINMSEDISFEDFKAVYELAYDRGCKGCTTYRPNAVTGSVIEVEKDSTPLDRDLVLSAAKAFLERSPSHAQKLKAKLTEMGASRVSDVLGPDKVNEARKLYNWLTESDETEKVVVETTPGLDDRLVKNLYGTKPILSDNILWPHTEALDDDEQKRKYETNRDALAARYGEGGSDNPAEAYREFARALAEQVGTGVDEEAIDRAAKFLEQDVAVALSEKPQERPFSLDGSAYKIKLGEQTTYVTVTDHEGEDGRRRPFEVFITTKDPSHMQWTSALALMISAIFRRPHDSRFVVEELKSVFDPKGGGFWQGKYWNSTVAAIGRVIEVHMIRIGYINDPKVPHEPEGISQPRVGRFASEYPMPTRVDRIDEAILRGVMSKESLLSNIAGFKSGGFVKDGPGLGPDEVAVQLSEPKIEMLRATCEKCHSTNLKMESGCMTCLECGHSKCG